MKNLSENWKKKKIKDALLVTGGPKQASKIKNKIFFISKITKFKLNVINDGFVTNRYLVRKQIHN